MKLDYVAPLPEAEIAELDHFLPHKVSHIDQLAFVRSA